LTKTAITLIDLHAHFRRRLAATYFVDDLAVEEPAMQADAFFQISKVVRYVALYLDGQLTLRERPGLANASASESDKYEELIVNPRGPDAGAAAWEY
jgi:hypothetical protein